MIAAAETGARRKPLMSWYEQFYTKTYLKAVGFADDEQTRRETAFVANALHLPPDSTVLDLCCGYGRHARALARHSGWQMTGFDLSEEYLRIARKDFAHPKVSYLRGDMRALPFESVFDAVINLFTSFGYFESDDENKQVLMQIHRALKPEGLLLLDYENKFYFVTRTMRDQGRFWMQPDPGTLFLCEHDYDVQREREVFRVHRVQNGRITDTSGYNIRLYSLPEITELLSEVGFEVLNTWGDYDGGQLEVSSKRVLLLARRIDE
jgi:ubiquinone/menaquinone biosynthesis C-methylase UbiE